MGEVGSTLRLIVSFNDDIWQVFWQSDEQPGEVEET